MNSTNGLQGTAGDSTASTSAAPSASSTSSSALPNFVPRAVKKRPLASSRPAQASAVVAPPPATSTANSSTVGVSTPLVAPPPPPALPPSEIQRLESILTVIESSFSTHGLTSYRSSGLLEKLKRSEWIHLSQVLSIVPVRALTSTLVDLKNAVSLRSSNIIKIDETGYQIAPKEREDYDALEKVELAEWDDLTIYLENIPFNTSLNAIHDSQPNSFSILHFLSTALDSRIQKLVFPALYDPKNPPEEDEEEDGAEEEGGTSQAEAFKASLRLKQDYEGEGDRNEKRKPRGLPRGGGPFKGFGFIVLPNRADVERVLEEWSGTGKQPETGEGEATPEEEDEDARMEDNTMSQSQGKGKGKAKPELTCREKAKRGGMKAITYSRWLELKKEYLSYRKTLENLLEAQASGELDQLRNPPDTKDRPPHLQHLDQQQSDPSSAATSKPSRSKRASSPGGPHPPEASSGSNKRTKRASSPSTLGTPLTRHTRKLRTPSPLPLESASTTTNGTGGGGNARNTLDLTSDVALSIQGAYPEGCVLWVRNVHEKSSKTSLKTLFGKLLDELQEGSGKGVEFVDYEKGLETCYIRFSSAPLAALTESHLLSTITYHLSQQTLSPVDSLSEPELEQAQRDLRRPIAAELLKGHQERQYWASLPESTRKAARLGAGGKVGLIKEPRGYAGSTETRGGEDLGTGNARGGENGYGNGDPPGEPSRKRKRPSRM